MYNYKYIYKRLKQCKKDNKTIKKKIDDLQVFLNKSNKIIVNDCKKQIYKKLQIKIKDPYVYNKSPINRKKIIGGLKDLSYIYKPYKYILKNCINLKNELEKIDEENNNSVKKYNTIEEKYNAINENYNKQYNNILSYRNIIIFLIILLNIIVLCYNLNKIKIIFFPYNRK